MFVFPASYLQGMALIIKKSKLANGNTKDLIFGYLKRTQLSQMVKYLTLAFYNIPEYFNKYNEAHFDTTNDETAIKCIKGIDQRMHQIFGYQRILSTSNKIYKWKLDLNNIYGYCYFGIIGEPDHELNAKSTFGYYNHSMRFTYPYYMIHWKGRAYSPYFKGRHQLKKGARDIFKSIKSVEIILNLSKGELSCIVNNDKNKEFIVFDNIKREKDISYKLSVAMTALKNEEIEIINFDMQ